MILYCIHFKGAPFQSREYDDNGRILYRMWDYCNICKRRWPEGTPAPDIAIFEVKEA